MNEAYWEQIDCDAEFNGVDQIVTFIDRYILSVDDQLTIMDLKNNDVKICDLFKSYARKHVQDANGELLGLCITSYNEGYSQMLQATVIIDITVRSEVRYNFPKSKLENDKSGSTLCDNSKDYEVI